MINRRKNRYQQKIIEYENRMDSFRKVYNVSKKGGRKASEEYYKKTKIIRGKIKTWKKWVDRMNRKEEEIEAINKKMIEFCGVDMKDSANKKDKFTNLYRATFYTWCLDNGFIGSYISIYTGADRWTAGRSRITFRNKRQNLEMLYRFNNFMKREEND